MAALKQGRVTASSLVEVTIAAAILVLVLALGLAICARLALTGPNAARLRGQLAAQQVAAETIRTRALQARTVWVGQIEVEQEILPYAKQPHLLEVRFTARQGPRVLARLHRLLYAPPPDTP